MQLIRIHEMNMEVQAVSRAESYKEYKKKYRKRPRLYLITNSVATSGKVYQGYTESEGNDIESTSV